MPSERVAIVGGVRTPFAKAFTELDSHNAASLAKLVTQELIQRLELPSDVIEQSIWGTVLPTMTELNIGREVPLALGLTGVPGYTLGQQCASGIQAVTSGATLIQAGQVRSVIAGGTESMSNTPVVYRKRLLQALQGVQKARGIGKKFKALGRVKWGDFVPRPPAIAEPSTGLSMGQHAEIMAQLNGISREEQDIYAKGSHDKAAAARDGGKVIENLVPVPLTNGSFMMEDNLIREDTTLEKLAQLRPVFDRKHGTITAGSSSPLTDGASVVMLMSESRARELGLTPWGFIRAYAYVAIPPHPQLLLGPAYSTPLALDRAGLTLRDMDLVEIHEAFAAQVLSVLQKWGSTEFARDELGRGEPVGEVSEDRLNVNGGSLAYGHPFAATGGRIMINLLQELRRRDRELGLLSICAANAMGVTMVLERN